MRRTWILVTTMAVGVALAVGGARAAEQTILGNVFVVKDSSLGADPTKRVVKGKGKETGSPNGLVGNPTLAGSAGGAVLQLFAFGASSSNQAFVLPQGTSLSGKPFWSVAGNVGYKYSDPKGQNGAVKSLGIKRTPSGSFTIVAVVIGKNGPVTVLPPNPGTSGCMALKLGISAGAGDRYSVAFGPDSLVKNQGAKLFLAKKPVVQSVCPGATPTTTTTSTTSTTSTTVSTTTSTTSTTLATTTTTTLATTTTTTTLATTTTTTTLATTTTTTTLATTTTTLATTTTTLATTTTTLATTTTTTTSTTTTTIPSANPSFIDFTTTTGGASNCGATFNATSGGTKLSDLKCGGLDLGGGFSTVLENISPDGATNRFAVTGCAGTVCTLGPVNVPPSGTIDCSATNCAFGPPLPIPNGGQTTCIVNKLSAPVSGQLDIAAGTTSNLGISLSSDTFITGSSHVSQPCPRCVVSGTPSPTNPLSGTCDRGARSGLACITTNSQGLSKDCVPGGSDGSIHVGIIPIALTPLTTGSLVVPASSVVSGGGIFCPSADPNANQTSSQRGCFKSGGSTCQRIEENGSPAGSLQTFNVAKNVTLASVFCVRKSGSVLVDASANLPGPGAVTLVGTLTALP